jgi:DNA-binding LytR/AlgR family response regulator
MSKIKEIGYGDKEMYIKQSLKIYRLKYENIISISVDRPYIMITIPDKNIYMETSLTKLETNLPDFFFRCNRKTVVNLMHVLVYKESDGNLYTNLGKVYNVSFRRRKYCMKRIDRINKQSSRCVFNI